MVVTAVVLPRAKDEPEGGEYANVISAEALPAKVAFNTLSCVISLGQVRIGVFRLKALFLLINVLIDVPLQSPTYLDVSEWYSPFLYFNKPFYFIVHVYVASDLSALTDAR